MICKLTDHLAQAIGDPGSITPRADGETITRWSTRAVEAVLEYATPSEGLDARFAAVGLTVHCSHCGEPYENEFGPVRFASGQLSKLGDYGLDDENWIVNLDGLHSDTVGDRKLVCPSCADAGWCDICDEEIRAWQHVAHAVDLGVVHEGCCAPVTAVQQPSEKNAQEPCATCAGYGCPECRGDR